MGNTFYEVMPTKAFEATLQELPQSKMTLLPYLTNKGQKKGEEAYFNQIQAMTANTGRVRYGEHDIDYGEFSRRRVVPQFHYLATQLDSKDAVESLVDPRSDLSMQIQYALGRKCAQQVMAAAFGTAYTGKAGGTSESFNAASTDVVAAAFGGSGSTGMNINKIVEAIRLAKSRGIDPNDPRNELTLVVSPKVEADMKLQEKLTSLDYQTSAALAGLDMPKGLLGIKQIVVDEACPYANDAATGINESWSKEGFAADDAGANDIRMCAMLVKSGMAYAQWESPFVRSDELQKNHYDPHVYSRIQIGVTRMIAQGGVIGILSDQTP